MNVKHAQAIKSSHKKEGYDAGKRTLTRLWTLVLTYRTAVFPARAFFFLFFVWYAKFIHIILYNLQLARRHSRHVITNKKFTRQYYLSSCTPHELQFITLYKKHYNKIKVQLLIKPIFGINSKFSIVGFRDLNPRMQRIVDRRRENDSFVRIEFVAS